MATKRRKVMKYLICVCCLCLAGCHATEEKEPSTFIQGNVVDVEICQEDTSNISVLIEFEDKFVKGRMHYDKLLNIPKGEVGIFMSEDSTILNIVTSESLRLLDQKN